MQIVAWTSIFVGLANYSARQTTSARVTLPVSIILCARNEAENLRRHLPVLLAQQFDSPWELLVVDDASEDDTPAVLQFFQEKNTPRLRVLRIAEKQHPGKKYALAQGIAAAKYNCLLLTDADCLPASPHWLAHMANSLADKSDTEIVLGYAPFRNGFFARYETAYTATQYFSFALAGMPYMGVGRNLAFRREIFEETGGFSAHAHLASGDDDLLVNAAATAHNTAVCLAPEAFVYSDAPRDLRGWFRQKRRHLSVGKAYRGQHQWMLAAVSFSLVLHYGLGTILLLAGIQPGVVLVLYLLRLLIVFFIFGKILRSRLHERDLRWQIPLHDGLLAVYYGAVVPWFLFGKAGSAWK